MKKFWIYSAVNNSLLGTVLANNWIDARSIFAATTLMKFGDVFACADPL
jgi:hypothetical protein